MTNYNSLEYTNVKRSEEQIKADLLPNGFEYFQEKYLK